jgi:hypothetical protein
MAEPDRISVPEGKIERVVNLKDLSLGGSCLSGWLRQPQAVGARPQLRQNMLGHAETTG